VNFGPTFFQKVVGCEFKSLYNKYKTELMEFSYKKHDNDKLFSSLEKTELGIKKLQNYIPLYSKFFVLNETNWNTINLNNEFYLNNISGCETANIVNGVLKNLVDKQKPTKKVFFKYSPLLDPIKYLIGKYDITDPTLLQLPSFLMPTAGQEKTRDMNNSAYVDSFFSFLTSKLLHTHGFLNGIDFYGSFLSIKADYPVNIYDDIEYINDFDFFHKHKDTLFTVAENYTELVGSDTRNYKQKLHFSTNEVVPLQLSDITELVQMDLDMDILVSQVTDVSVSNGSVSNPLQSPDVIYQSNTDSNTLTLKRSNPSSLSSSSSCSSRSSVSSKGDMDLDQDNDMSSADEAMDEDAMDEGEDEDDDDDDYSTLNGEEVLVKIKEFPVQTIALECCEDTLNSLIENDEDPLREEEWDSIVLQILMSLITFQNAFQLTHNDLHSNNIMYTSTEKQFLYYKVDGAYYKVPTFGKIFKIIDFGRAIYKFKGELMCSDSFHPKGDAATQYNFLPYFNPKKPVIEPNFSFDLCRLSCSIYDELVEDISEEHLVTVPILKIILDWCKDDKGRNIMYKKNGDERYPDFKLYKMISRKVHKHVPLDVLRHAYFEKYKVTKKKLGKDKTIINIDEIPSYA
jgi:hypothetical protein